MMMLWMQMVLAEAVVTHGTQGEVSTITTGAISAIAGGIVSVLVMYFRTRTKVTVDGAVSVDHMPGKREPQVSWTEVRDLKDRMSQVERRVDEIKAAQGKNFVMIMESQHASELRLMDKIEKSISPVHNRIDEMLRVLAERKKPQG
jgi:hypothetical protein